MNLCYAIADRIHRYREQHAKCQNQIRRSDHDCYWKWQYDTSPAYFDKFFDLSIKLPQARVIDVGCGLGGRTCYLAGLGAHSVVGVDINHSEVAQANALRQRLSNADTVTKVQFKTVDELAASEVNEQFDVALLVDSLEHVIDPTAILNQTYKLLKPGGVCYFSTWGWYHHQASHVGSIIPVPFATVFFSDKQILDAVRKVVDQHYYQPSMWDSDPPSLRWQNIDSLHDRPGEYLNKFTIGGFRKAMAASDFCDGELKAEGFSTASHPILAWFNFLSRVPIVQEVFHSAVFGRLVKNPSNASGAHTSSQLPQPLRKVG